MTVAYMVKITGRVTGVGFRYSALHEAQKYPNLAGFIKNVSDDEIKVLVQGDENDVTKFISWLKQGPSSAIVEKFKINEIPIIHKLYPFRIAY